MITPVRALIHRIVRLQNCREEPDSQFFSNVKLHRDVTNLIHIITNENFQDPVYIVLGPGGANFTAGC